MMTEEAFIKYLHWKRKKGKDELYDTLDKEFVEDLSIVQLSHLQETLWKLSEEHGKVGEMIGYMCDKNVLISNRFLSVTDDNDVYRIFYSGQQVYNSQLRLFVPGEWFKELEKEYEKHQTHEKNEKIKMLIYRKKD